MRELVRDGTAFGGARRGNAPSGGLLGVERAGATDGQLGQSMVNTPVALAVGVSQEAAGIRPLQAADFLDPFSSFSATIPSTNASPFHPLLALPSPSPQIVRVFQPQANFNLQFGY
jgi:hypothetical protein